MIESILSMDVSELQALASAIRVGRLTTPFSALALQRVLPARKAASVAKSLEALGHQGATTLAIATMLELLLQERRRHVAINEAIDLVTTGPEADGISNRDTSVVVRELFADANESVLIAGYAVYQGQTVFAALADRMMARPQLQVRMFLDIQRPNGDTSTPAELATRFADRFSKTQWPTERPIPSIYFYPLSMHMDSARRASLHAKCVVVDGQRTFVSSANFTEAAQKKNVEVGVLIRSALVADQVIRHFDALVAAGFMAPLVIGAFD